MRAVSLWLVQHQALESCIWKPECELKRSADSAPLLWDGSKYSTTGSENTESYKCAGRENYAGTDNSAGHVFSQELESV